MTEKNQGRNLIFLVSQPRSGSTLLQKMLGAHPDIVTASEPWIALHPLFALREHGIGTDYNHQLAHAATLEFLRLLPDGEETYFAGVRRMLGHLYDSALAGKQKNIFLDKTPRYYFVLPELRKVFPQARFVFLLRNPLAVLTSILETWTKKNEDPVKALRPFRFDLLTAPRMIAAEIKKLGEGAITVRYEELVQTPEPVMRGLCNVLGISYDGKMIEYGADTAEKQRWKYGDQGTVYRESRPVTDRANRWQDLFAASTQLQAVGYGYLATLGRQLVADLGYDYEDLAGKLSPADQADSEAICRAFAEIDREDSEGTDQLQHLREIADERLADLLEKDRALSELRSSLVDVSGQLEWAVSTVHEQELRSTGIEAAAAERLAELEAKDRALGELRSSLVEVSRQLEHAVATVHAQELRSLALEAVAAERLAGLEEKDRALDELRSSLVDVSAQLERAVGTVHEQHRRSTVLEAAAAERLAGLEEKDRALERLRSLSVDLSPQLESALHTIREQDQRFAFLRTEAAERLVEDQKKDRELQSALVRLDEAHQNADSLQQTVVESERMRQKLEYEQRLLAGENNALKKRIHAFEEESLLGFVKRRSGAKSRDHILP